jgi:hypothetical protein
MRNVRLGQQIYLLECRVASSESVEDCNDRLSPTRSQREALHVQVYDVRSRALDDREDLVVCDETSGRSVSPGSRTSWVISSQDSPERDFPTSLGLLKVVSMFMSLSSSSTSSESGPGSLMSSQASGASAPFESTAAASGTKVGEGSPPSAEASES